MHSWEQMKQFPSVFRQQNHYSHWKNINGSQSSLNRHKLKQAFRAGQSTTETKICAVLVIKELFVYQGTGGPDWLAGPPAEPLA